MFGEPLYWRESHRQPRFLIFDGRIVILILLTIMHIRIWTVILTVLAMAALFWFERKGVGTESILRYLRSALVGRRRTARGPAEERAATDYGFETRERVAAMRSMIARRNETAIKARGRMKNKKAKGGARG